MEVAPCTLEVGHHSASLLKHLSLQRQQAQFCDCVLRQSDSSGHLFPAHRCLLAASSPVLASILPSTGALVELRDPCLTDSVLALLLDFIYSGTLAWIHNQQEYDRLLTAACHLQMEELQEALKAAWPQTEVDTAVDSSTSSSTEIQASKDSNDPYGIPLNPFSNLLSSHITDAFGRHEDTSMQHSFSAGTFHAAQIHSPNIDSSVKDEKTSISRNDPHSCSVTERDLRDVKTYCILKGTDGLNVMDYRQGTYLTQEGSMINTPGTAEMLDISGGNKHVDEDHFSPAGCVQAEVFQRKTEEGLPRMCDDGTSSSLLSSSLPQPCSGAVPVICHSSRATGLPLAEEPEVPALFGSGRTSVSRSASTDNDRTVGDISTKHKDQHSAQDQLPRHNKKRTHSEFEQDCNSSPTDQYMITNTKQKYKDNIVQNDQHAHCDLSQRNTKHLGEDLFPQYEDWDKGSKHKNEDGADDLPSKHQRLDCFECLNVSLATATKEPSQNRRAGVPLLKMDSDTGSDSHCEDLCLDMEAKEEHNYFSRRLTEMDKLGSRCNLYGPESSWFSTTYRGEKSRKEAVYEYDPNSRFKATKYKVDTMELCRPVCTASESGSVKVTGSFSAFECCKSLEPEKIEEQCLTLTTSVDNKMYDTATSPVGQSHQGHLHYPCIQGDRHLSHRGSDHKPPHSGHTHHSHESSDGDEAGTSAISGPKPSQGPFATESTHQVLLLDTHTQPAEVPAHCKHGSAVEENETGNRITAEMSTRDHDREQNSKGSALRTEMKKIRKRTCVGSESSDETNARTSAEERQPVGKDHNTPEAQVRLKAGGTEVSSPNEDENKTITWPECSSVTAAAPDAVQAPSTISVCISSTLSVCMPTDMSADVSCHQPFQCSLCDRSFSQRGSLNRHVRSHLGVRPFPCPCCPMTFSRQYRVTEHMRVHQRCAFGNDFQKHTDSSMKGNK
ncbi:uncharacterized protein LOC133421359 [Cololabis saira]|uniref:uncharacterized protein LOC133421359 n=1 Tax=Cololabis saira TaxID=129043 RepID=UPI002AD24451|nr:uncharacterized protein LOC133421359 [Cololabis saira]